MTSIAPRLIGCRRSVSFKIAEIDVVTADVDLLVVGMFEQNGANTLGGGASQLDQALHGTLGRLREGGIFKGMAGETLMLSTPPPPILARSLMLIGMGDSLSASSRTIAQPTELAMRTALRMEVRSVGCLLTWLGNDASSKMIESLSTMMMEGALRAIDECTGSQPMPILEWIFHIWNDDAERIAVALRRTISPAS